MNEQPDPQPSRTDAAAPPRSFERHRYDDEERRQHGPFLPLLLGLLALGAWFGLQTSLLLEEKTNLRNAHAAQQQTVEKATQLRQSLDGIAADTQRLADTGNANARLLVDELRKRGVTINTQPAGSGAQSGK